MLGLGFYFMFTGRLVSKDAHEQLRTDKDKEIAQLRVDKDKEIAQLRVDKDAVIKDLRDDNEQIGGQRDTAVKAMQELTPHLGASAAALSAIEPVMEENVYLLRLHNERDPAVAPVRRRRRPPSGSPGASGGS
jgi:hypothetical protein